MDGPECKVQGNRMLQLDKLFGNWQEINEKTLSKHTALTKKGRVRRFLEAEKITELTQINYFHVQNFLNGLVEYYAPNTISNWKQAISSFCTYLVKRELLAVHPCRLAEIPRHIMVSPVYLEDDQVHRFIAAAEMFGVSLPIKIAVSTGMRRQEIANLQ